MTSSCACTCSHAQNGLLPARLAVAAVEVAVLVAAAGTSQLWHMWVLMPRPRRIPMVQLARQKGTSCGFVLELRLYGFGRPLPGAFSRGVLSI